MKWTRHIQETPGVLPRTDPNDPANWSASSEPGGSPGRTPDTTVVLDADNDGLGALLEEALGTSDTDPSSGQDAFSVFVEGEILHFRFQKSAAADLEFAMEISDSLGIGQRGRMLRSSLCPANREVTI